MQRIIEKYHEKIDQLNVFEKQILRNLLNYSASNGMSRFYMVFDQSQLQPQKLTKETTRKFNNS
ncbi:MAG: hypothetical protein JKY48_02250 [Flavobacteriales bacterium]|nr:hypothetical protein [Flavobacteriales bacterium]